MKGNGNHVTGGNPGDEHVPTPASAVLAEIREAGATSHLLRAFATARGMKVAQSGVPGRGILHAWIKAGKPTTFDQDTAVDAPADPDDDPTGTQPDDEALAAADAARAEVIERLNRLVRQASDPVPYPLRSWWHDEISALADLLALAVRARRAGLTDLPRDLELAAVRVAQTIAQPVTEEDQT